ncbi:MULTISPECIES: acyl carrier protein [Streptomyces]|uniref:Acyl carrier protein n=1 Tax=Streptomyces gibsoniae TaxID=3075529 RepID=A0ABU2TM28_9ACTN|nr:acyl carrier protein [Streptomyces sp. DSM 41699]MDT0462003.1 acyl carrier protein [Streptomyces sp. DSM 41699]
MDELTLDGLREIMRHCVGTGESVNLDGDIGDTAFTDLGYDSLAVLEVVTQVQGRLGVAIPDEALNDIETPGALIEYVAAQKAGA